MTQMAMLVYGLVYLIVALVFGVLTIYLFFKIFNVLTRNIDDINEIKQNNLAVGIINAAVVFAVSLFINESIQTAMEVFKNNIIVYGANLSGWEKTQTYFIMVAHYVISLLLAFFLLWISIKIFTKLTRSIDEFEEIKKNNHAVGLLLAVVILSMSIIIKPGIGKFLKGIISYPTPKSASGLNTKIPLKTQTNNEKQSENK